MTTIRLLGHCMLQHCAATTSPEHANAGLIYTWVDGSQEQMLGRNDTAGRYQTSTSTIEPWDEGGLHWRVLVTAQRVWST